MKAEAWLASFCQIPTSGTAWHCMTPLGQTALSYQKSSESILPSLDLSVSPPHRWRRRLGWERLERGWGRKTREICRPIPDAFSCVENESHLELSKREALVIFNRPREG
jgi:hypothetical protein